MDSEQRHGDMKFTLEDAKVFFNQSADAFAILDLENGRVVTTNNAHDELLSSEATHKRSFIEVVHPDDRAVAIADLESMQEGQRIRREIRCLQEDGTYRWMEWQSSTVGGRVYAVGRDVESRKENESRIRELVRVVESASEAIIRVDDDRKIASWNRGARLIFGYEDDEIIGLPVSRLFGDGIDIDDAMHRGDAQELECICVRSDGRQFDGALTACRLFDELHNLTGHALFFRDVSERKAVQKRISEIYSVVSHELRTPLTSIRATMGLMAEGVVDLRSDEALELILIARDSAERLIRLVNEVLDMQKIEAGKMQLVKQEVEPQALIKQAVKEAMALADAAGTPVEWHCAGNVPCVVADADKIVQVLTNLISNAIKFSPHGEPIVITCTTDGALVRFSVTDRGPGIPQEQSDKLFAKFQQLDSSDSRRHGGTGLGLAISKALVTAHGGSIGFVNQSPGCTLWFELPTSKSVQKALN